MSVPGQRTTVVSPASGGGRPPRRSRLRVTLALLGLAVCAGIVLAMTLSPTPLDAGYESAIDRFLGILHRNGVPEWFGYSKLEFTANVLMFVPLGFLVALALPRRAVWATVLLVPAFSGLIEASQSAFLSERFASILDVVANTAGGYGGALVALVLRAVVDSRDRRLVARALWDHGIR